MTAVIQQTKPDGWRQRATDGVPGERARMRRDDAYDGADQLARGLGWFSLALGTAEVLAPRSVARLIGAEETETTCNTLIAIGLREIASGVGILTQPQPAGWLWGRVGGDAIDLALLGSALGSDDTDRTRASLATAAVLGVTVLDVIVGRRLSEGGDSSLTAAKPRGIHVTRTITINRPPIDVYTFWRDFENLPRFMDHLQAVQVLDDRRSHWKAKAPAGTTVEWDAEIVQDTPGQTIAWRSVEDADVANAGSVRFVPAPAPGPAGDATEVHVELQYSPPGGGIGATIAKLFGEEPSQQIAGDLRRLKQVMETGEVVHSDASIHRGMHPARPPADQF